MTREEKCLLAIELGFVYDDLTGLIKTPTGIIASKKTKNGYIMLCFRNEYKKLLYLYGHQFGWYFVHKECVNCLDHINQIKTDNRIINLRSVTKSQNAMNMKNVKGYYFSKRDNKFISYIMVNSKVKQLGSFDNESDAKNCYLENKNKYHIIN